MKFNCYIFYIYINYKFSYLYTCLYSYYCIYYDNLDEEAKDTKIMGIGLGSNLIIKDSVFLLLSTSIFTIKIN